MKTLASAIALLLLLSVGSNALARKIIWDGVYQAIERGANMKQAEARITLAGDPKRPTAYVCSYTLDGKAQTVQFNMDQCVRTGSHVVCTRPKDGQTEPLTGDACWGDVYYKKPHPAGAGK